MATLAELYSALKYRVEVLRNGIRVHYNAQGYLHCEDGPAIEYASGCKTWYQNGLRHRINGHAIEWPDGNKEWFLNGKKYTEQAYYAQLKTLEQTS